MALDESAMTDLLAALRVGGGLDVVREALALVLQALIDAEATEVIGAGRYERSAARTTHRNGTRPRLLSTKAGDVELKIPKLREGAFFPALLEPRRRIDRALLAVVMQAYVHGTSTRKVDDLVKALGVDSGISKSEVSRICAELDHEVGAFRSRSLAHIAFVIGGPLGLSPKILQRSNELWSFGSITLPHALARVVLLEQLYRAAKINRNEKYHW